MASNQVLKKSIVGGFKKEDVINYVEQLQAEIYRLRNDAAQMSNELGQYDELRNAYVEANRYIDLINGELAAVKAELETVRSERTALAAENELLKVEKQSLETVIENVKKEKSDADQLHAKELEQVKSENENKIRLFEEKFSSIESTFATIEANRLKNNNADEEACKILKDANDRSALIITYANNEAQAIAEKSNAAVIQAAKQVTQANERLKSACVNYDSSTVELKESVNNLIAVLESLSEENDK